MRRCKTGPTTATLLLAAALIPAAAQSQAPAQPQETDGDPMQDGRQLYVRHCAPCHGLSARGDGPAAQALRSPPPDLTRLREPGGRFPAGRIFDIIEGSKVVRAHGSRTMPVWGVELRNQVGYSESQRQIHLLVRYLESIQSPR